MARKRILQTVTITEQSNANASANVMNEGNSQENTGNNSNVQPRKRGKTMYRELHDLPPNRKLPVMVNEWGQPIGDNARILAGWCGVTVRLHCPLHYAEWHKVPKATKTKLIEHITKKFEIPDSAATWLKKTLGKRFKDAKYELKSSYFDENEPEELNLNNCPSDVVAYDWEYLVTQWTSREGKEVSQRNTRNRECQVSSHTSGSKSYARFEHELNVEAGKRVGKLVVMEKTHVRKDGTFVDLSLPPILDEVKQKIAELPKEPTYMEELALLTTTLGGEKNGMVRGMGLGPTPSTVFAFKYSATSHTSQELHTLQSEVVQQRELIHEQDEKLSKQEDLILKQEEKLLVQEERIRILDQKLDSLLKHDGSHTDVESVAWDRHTEHLKKYAKYVGPKTDFRLVVRGVARNMIPILKGAGTVSCQFLVAIWCVPTRISTR